MSVFDERKVDSHCHILDPSYFPYSQGVAYHPTGQETGTLAQYLQVMDAYDIRHALLVSPNSGYGLDNRFLLDALQQGNGRFRGVAVVPNDIGRSDLLGLRDGGVAGVAFNATVLGTEYYAKARGLLRHLAELDMFVSVQVEHDQILALRAILEDSGVRMVFDHCGRPRAGGTVDQRGFQALLALARTGRAAVKLSGFQKFSQLPPPYSDAQPFLQALLEAFTPEACMWASDWPFLKSPVHMDVGPLIRQLERLVPNAEDRNKVLWDTPRRWLGFS